MRNPNITKKAAAESIAKTDAIKHAIIITAKAINITGIGTQLKGSTKVSDMNMGNLLSIVFVTVERI